MSYTLSLVLCMIAACGSSSGGGDRSNGGGVDTSFGSPQEVTINGYNGHAMEPFISRDGTVLFFNNLTADFDPVTVTINDTDIHYAGYVSGGDTFLYAGPLTGVITDSNPAVNELEGVASLDVLGNFFYTNMINYSPGSISTIYTGTLVAAPAPAVVGITPVGSMKNDMTPAVFGDVNMDVEVSSDGNTLYFTEAVFSGASVPDSANLGMATNDGSGNFSVMPNSADLMKNIHTQDIEYAPSVSTDEKELFFTRCVQPCNGANMTAIYVSRRDAITDPWGAPQRIATIDGTLVEAPTISSDGTYLYYHKKESSGLHKIYRVTRQ